MKPETLEALGLHLPAMAASIHADMVGAGFWSDDVEKPFPTQAALFHTELSEASESLWRWQQGATPMCPKTGLAEPTMEIADFAIRVLDSMESMGQAARLAEIMAGLPGVVETPGTLVNLAQRSFDQAHWSPGDCEFHIRIGCLHWLVSRAVECDRASLDTPNVVRIDQYLALSLAWACETVERLARPTGQVHTFVDAIELKCAYNRTRSRKHGGKRY